MKDRFIEEMKEIIVRVNEMTEEEFRAYVSDVCNIYEYIAIQRMYYENKINKLNKLLGVSFE